MYTGQIAAAINSSNILASHSKGVHAADHLPNRFPVNTFFIANTDIFTKPGKHWVCFYKVIIQSHTCIEFFDSAGLGPGVYSKAWLSYIAHQADFYRYNSEIIQDPISTYCGVHCLCFALLRSLGFSFNTIVRNIYSSNLCYNDQIARKYLEKFIDIKILQKAKTLQSCTDALHYFTF